MSNSIFSTAYAILTGIVAVMLVASGVNAQNRVERWVNKIDGGSHIQGTFSKDVGVPPLTFISFHTKIESYQFYRGQELYVHYYAPEDLYFFLSIEEKEVTKFYRLESKPDTLEKGKGGFGPIKVDNLLSRLIIPDDNLASLLRVKSDDSNYVLPVSLTQSDTAGDYRYNKALFRLGRSISRGSFSVYKGEHKGSLTGESPVQRGVLFKQPGGSILQISIDRQKLAGYEGWVSVDMNLSEKGTPQKFAFRFYFYHHE